MDVSTILIGQENERRSNAMKKNKAIFILLLFILTISLVGCAKQENNKDVGVFEGVVSWDINLDTYLGYPIHDAIDEKLALDIGNVVIRSIYGEEILKKTDMNIKDRITIVSAISNHDESTGGAVDMLGATFKLMANGSKVL